MLTVNYEKCTGCGACVQRCPAQCISWTGKEFGFRYPQIDESACVHCGLCEQVCPIEFPVITPLHQKVYAAVHKDPEILKKSTSGGAFTAIADCILTHGGVVYGAAMMENMQVKHIRVDDRNGLAALRGSKYVQSDTAATYQQAEDDLKRGKAVLYSGTPCQVDGLKRFLKKDYENLYTVDMICHGIASQSYFDRFMDFARKKYGNVQAIYFRGKEFSGWSVNGAVVAALPGGQGERHYPFFNSDNYYFSYFLSGEIYRRSCYTCKYANTNRIGNFSLGDYWGVEALNLPLHTENGCSLLIVNDERAARLLETISELDLVETTMAQAAHGNKQLNTPSKLPESRRKRLDEFDTMSGEQIQAEYFKTHRMKLIIGKLKAAMPYRLKLFVRRMKK